MQDPTTVPGLSDTIEISIAPVFLLSAVAVILGVLTNRLSRIVDRARALDSMEDDPARADGVRAELKVLEKRRQLILQAVNMCTYCAVLVAAVIAALFVAAFLRLDLSVAVGWVFVAAMGALIVGLLAFLAEVRLALRWVRKGGASGFRA